MIARQLMSTLDDLELAYWVQPSAAVASDRALLLIHGAASNHTRWSEFVEHTELTHSWNIICPDMRGNGASMTRGLQDMTSWCHDLLDILAAEKAGGAVVTGHSLGAQIAINFAHRNPEQTRGLVLIDPVFQGSLQGRQRFVFRHRRFALGLLAVIRALNAMGIHRRHIVDRDLRELDRETRIAIAGDESFDEIAKRYGALGPILKYMPTANYLRQALETIEPLPPVSDIDVPVLVLLSGGTTLADLELNRKEVAKFPDSQVVTLEANHWPLTETPDAVRTAIEEWLSCRFGTT